MPRVRPARGSRSKGSHFPSAWLRSMRRTPLAKKRRAAIANSARAGLYTPRALVRTAGLATRPGNSTSSIPAEREWTQGAPRGTVKHDHRPGEPDPPAARADRDADDLGGPRVPPLGGQGGGDPAAGPGGPRDRHLRRPGLRRPRPVHDAGRPAGLGAAPALAVPLPRSEPAHLRPPEGPRPRGVVPVPGSRQPGGGGDREDLLEAALPFR